MIYKTLISSEKKINFELYICYENKINLKPSNENKLSHTNHLMLEINSLISMTHLLNGDIVKSTYFVLNTLAKTFFKNRF